MRKLIVFSGAGLSADSGIPTFRDTNGLWENFKVEEVASHEAWFKDKEKVLRFYQERFEQYHQVQPHDGHHALFSLEKHFDVLHITQNIDNLLESAGCTNVIHIHGSMYYKKCELHESVFLKRPYGKKPAIIE